MAKEALTMPGLDGNPQFQSVVARIRAREKERQEVSDKRQQGAEAVADPRESMQGFETLFAQRRFEIEGLLAADLDAQSIGQRLDALDELVSQSSYFLPSHVVRQTLVATADLRTRYVQRLGAGRASRTFEFGHPADASASPAADARQLKPARPPASQPSLARPPHSVAVSPSTLLIEHESRKRIVLRAASVSGRDVTLRGLRDCDVALCGAPAAVYARDLAGCRLALGPVAGAVRAENLRDCLVLTAAHQLRLHDCADCALGVAARSAPVIERCRRLRAGPYALRYEGLERDALSAGLGSLEGDESYKQAQDFGWRRPTPTPHWEAVDGLAGRGPACVVELAQEDTREDLAEAGQGRFSPEWRAPLPG